MIVGSFYAPPHTSKSAELIEHLTVNTQSLLQKYPNAGILICGDRNNIEINRFLGVDHSLKQIVTKPTRKGKILDIILTNMHKFYCEPEICPPVKPDKEGTGVPSDQDVPVTKPRTNVNIPKREYRERLFRPYPQSGLFEFGKWLSNESFECLKNTQSPSQTVTTFETFFMTKLELHIPLKKAKYSSTDKPWITYDLSHLARQKQREYTKNGKSEKYIKLKQLFIKNEKEAISNYRQKRLDSIKNASRNAGYSILKKMGSRLGEEVNMDLKLPCHEGLSTQQIADSIADHFSSISDQYKSLELSDLSIDINREISQIDKNKIPQVEEHVVYKNIKAAKKPNGTLPGDIPKRVIEEFSINLASRATLIINQSLRSLEYPETWKIEYATPIPKISQPETMDDIRLISLTKFLSKVYEGFLADWILAVIGSHLDPNQFGGLKGNAITHYLIQLVDFILKNLDSRQPVAIIAAIIDFSKAFNRMSHQRIITIMYEMKLPGWILKLIISYLTKRKLIVRYKDCSSSERTLKCGAPAGTILGVITFLIQMDGIKAFPVIQSPETPLTQAVKSSQKNVKSPNTICKFIDDVSAAAVINLKCLKESEIMPKPVVYHNRTGHYLPNENNPIIEQMKHITEFASTNQMKLNTKKSHIMLFSRSKKKDFQTEVYVNGSLLDVHDEAKILGTYITSDLKWKRNTQYIQSKCMKKVWMLRRIRELGGSQDDLLQVYIRQIRCLTEIACPTWNDSLTQQDIDKLEGIQKVVCRVILGQKYVSYHSALHKLKIPTLSERRKIICRKFAQKTARNKKFSSWFPRSIRGKARYVQPFARTSAYQKSAIPSFINLLNNC